MENEIISVLLNSKISFFIGGIIAFWVLVKRIDRVNEKIDRVNEKIEVTKSELTEKIELVRIEVNDKIEVVRSEFNEKIHSNELKNQEDHASLRLLVEKLIWYVEGNRRIEHPSGETDTEK